MRARMSDRPFGFTGGTMGGQSGSSIRFTSFPKTKPPPAFILPIVEVFRAHERVIGTYALSKGLESEAVLHLVADDLRALGFEVEASKKQEHRLSRPVFFGENGV